LDRGTVFLTGGFAGLFRGESADLVLELLRAVVEAPLVALAGLAGALGVPVFGSVLVLRGVALVAAAATRTPSLGVVSDRCSGAVDPKVGDVRSRICTVSGSASD
jgi:hypothetical protein